MKRILLFSLFSTCLGMLGSKTAQAQITAVNIDYSTSLRDSITKTCVPMSRSVSFNGNVSGTYTASDSLTAHIYFGDGTSSTMRLPIHSPSNTFYGYIPSHTYSSIGSYYIYLDVTAPGGVKDSIISASFSLTDSCSTTTPGTTATVISGASLDSMMTVKCTLPYVYNMYVYGWITGPVSATDSAIVNVNFGDGSISTVTLPVFMSAATGRYYGNLSHTYSMTGTYAPVATVTISGSGAKDTVVLDSFVLNDSCGTLKGKLYLDDNSNCLRDAGESGLHWVQVRAVNTATSDTTWAWSWTDTSGSYSIDLNAGTYLITPMVNALTGSYWSSWGLSGDTVKATCPLSGSATVTVAASGTYTQNFAYECTPVDSFDASILVSATCFVPGDTAVMTIWAGDWYSIYHYACLGMTSSVTLTLDPKLSYIGLLDGKIPASVSGGVISWNLSGSDIADFNSRIKVAVATSATLGDTLRSTAYIAPGTGIPDPVLANNTYVAARVVVSSYDPNMKEAAPGGRGAQGYIATNTPMSYTIHFQNTGTAAARNITITDHIDGRLDAASLHMLSSTHDVTVYQEDKDVKFRFNNINLPDSGSNYYGSMGSVTYAILPLRDLAPGTEIRNTAAIYFDYNTPIITNTTLNTIETTTGLQHISAGSLNASIFPNPANSQLTVKLDNNTAFTVTVTDMLGRIAATEYNTGSVVIATSQLPAGMYLIQVADKTGNTLNAKVFIKH